MQKTVLITGASSGFGRLSVEQFLADGWRVVATMRRARERAHLFAEGHDRLVVLEGDITRESDRQRLAAWVREHAGNRLDSLVNNAGFGLFGPIEDLSEEQIRRQMEVNFFGNLLLTQDLLPALRAARGSIITVSSMLGVHSFPFTAGYCASKFAVEGWMEAMAGELISQGVSCYLVEPGGYPTEFGESIEWAKIPADSVYKKEADSYRQLRVKVSKRNVGKKDPAAVAALIHGLASQRPRGLRHAIGSDAKAMMLVARLVPRNVFQILMTTVFRQLLRKAEST